MPDAPLRPDSLRAARLVGITTAARELGLGQRTLRQAIARGELPLYRVGARGKLGVNDLRAWLERHRVPPRGP